MSVAPLTTPAGLPGAQAPSNLSPALPGLSALPSAEDFGQMMSEYMQQASEMQAKLGTDIEALASGQSDNIHEVVLSAAQADLAFRMVIEIRDRIVSTYQEIMRMQV
ncbi:MAG: flagellar hook-basal body complex protein FliE [Planctomycetaceae bacterium]